MPPNPNFFERMQASFLQLADYVPALAGALVVLFAGYLLAKLIERGTDRLLDRVGMNHWLERGGVLVAVERTGWRKSPSRLVATIVFWFVMFSVILLAANALGLASLASVFTELVSYIPSVIAAVVILLIGIVLGEFVDGLIMASAGGIRGGATLARVGRGVVVVLAILMALQQLGIASDIVTTAFAIVFGAVALAFALSFGLGNRELAGEVTREWYESMKAERARLARKAALLEAEEEAEERSARAVDEGGEGPAGRVASGS